MSIFTKMGIVFFGILIGATQAFAAGELPASVNGAWTPWHQVHSFPQSVIKVHSDVTMQLNANGTSSVSSASGSAGGGTSVGTAFSLPGLLLPIDQCDYRLKVSESQWHAYYPASKVSRDGMFLRMVFVEQSNAPNQLVRFKNFGLQFLVSNGNYYSQFTAYSEEFKINPPNMGVSYPYNPNMMFSLQRRCFIAGPVAPVKAVVGSSVSK